MKILVFSDSHGSLSGMRRAIDAHRPVQVIHLGDMQRDAETVAEGYPSIPFCIVPGNCDGWTACEPKKLITLDGKRILLSHGHLWQVKRNYSLAIAEAHKAGADAVLFGHTHRSECELLEDGLWLLNPGASRSSYGVISIEDGEMRCSVLPQV